MSKCGVCESLGLDPNHPMGEERTVWFYTCDRAHGASMYRRPDEDSGRAILGFYDWRGEMTCPCGKPMRKEHHLECQLTKATAEETKDEDP